MQAYGDFLVKCRKFTLNVSIQECALRHVIPKCVCTIVSIKFFNAMADLFFDKYILNSSTSSHLF